MTEERLRISVIGAGAIAEQGHVPAIDSLDGVDLLAVVDRDLERARTIAQPRHARAHTDHTDAIEGCDLAIVATPPALHAPMTIDFLRARVPVLVEKPMATCAAEARSMVHAAEQHGTLLAVGHSRRTYPLLQFARRMLLQRGAIGPLRRVLLCMGNLFNAWVRASDYITNAELAGGGVVQNYGPHLFDIVEDWFPSARIVDYEDDSRGGLELNAVVRLEDEDGLPIELRMSYTDRMGTECWFEGEDAVASFSPGDTGIQLEYHNGETVRIDLPERQLVDLPWAMARQIESVWACLRGEAQPLCSATSGAWVVERIEECYLRQPELEPA